MPAFICNTCGTQYAPSEKPPANCPICDDERQYVTPAGQSWTTLPGLQARSYNAWRELEPNLISIVTFPAFGIGQRAQLLRTPHGNILWDCIALIDRATIELINAMGGIKGIAISHPHYYTTMAEWSQAFGVPVHFTPPTANGSCATIPASSSGRARPRSCFPAVTLICAGGHYPGGTVLHWAAGAGGKGALLSGDIVQVVQDNKSVSFMWSFPNLIPLSGPRVEGVVKAVKPYAFDRVHGAFMDRTIWSDGKGVVERSAARYLRSSAATARTNYNKGRASLGRTGHEDNPDIVQRGRHRADRRRAAQSPKVGDPPEAKNMRLVGGNDLQARSAYQPTIHQQGDRWIAYIGHHGGTPDVPSRSIRSPTRPSSTAPRSSTSPIRRAEVSVHIPGQAGDFEGGGAQMARVCDGRSLPKGEPARSICCAASAARRTRSGTSRIPRRPARHAADWDSRTRTRAAGSATPASPTWFPASRAGARAA